MFTCLKSTRWKSLFSIKPTLLVTVVFVRRLRKLFHCLLPSSGHLSVSPAFVSLPSTQASLGLPSLAVSASLWLLCRCITFLGRSLKLTVLILDCSSYYNSSSNEQPHFTSASGVPFFSTGWKPHNLQDISILYWNVKHVEPVQKQASFQWCSFNFKC